MAPRKNLEWMPSNKRQLCHSPGQERVTGFTLSCALTHNGGCKKLHFANKAIVMETNGPRVRLPKQKSTVTFVEEDGFDPVNGSSYGIDHCSEAYLDEPRCSRIQK